MIFGYSGTIEHMQGPGASGALLPLVILTELGGGLCISGPGALALDNLRPLGHRGVNR